MIAKCHYQCQHQHILFSKIIFRHYIKKSIDDVKHDKTTTNCKMQIINLSLLPVLGRTKVTEVTVAITFNVKPIGKKLGSKLAKPIQKKMRHSCD